MTDSERAKKFLNDGATIALVRDVDVFTTDRAGIEPLLELAEQYKDLSGYCAANKFVGRAQALLYAYMGAEEVYGERMSLPAQQILRDNGITFFFGGLCDDEDCAGTLKVAEECVKDVSEPPRAARLIRAALSAGKGDK